PPASERVRGDATSRSVRLAGSTTRCRPAALKGRLLRVPRAESRRATTGAHLWADLVGLAAVTPDGRAVGEVRDLLRAGGTDVLVVVARYRVRRRRRSRSAGASVGRVIS